MKTNLNNCSATTVRKNLFSFFLMAFFMLSAGISTINAQEYHSKPTAINNLKDEYTYVMHQLENVIEKDTPEFVAWGEKARYIESFLSELETEKTVEEVAKILLPKYDLNKMQRAVRYFDGSFAGTTPNRYIRNEMLFLVAY